MPVAMAAADLVISRCGAASLAELEAWAEPLCLSRRLWWLKIISITTAWYCKNAGAGFVIEEKKT